MRKAHFFLLLCLAVAGGLRAQRYAPLVVRADLSMPLRKGLGGGVEWRYSPKSALSVEVSWEEHDKASHFGLFNGDLVANFAHVQIDTIKGLGQNKIHTSSTYYVGEGRPLPLLPEYIALSSMVLRLGHKFVFGKKRSRWQWSLQPSFSLVKHHYFEVKQTFDLLEESKQSQTFGAYPFQWSVAQVYGRYFETQAMREHIQWIPGLAYDIGIGRRVGARWLVEARLSGLYNPQPAYKAPQPAPARVTQVRGHLLLGYSIGRMR
jgi:hypothetical protein